MAVQSPVIGNLGSSDSAFELGLRMLEAAEEAVNRWVSREAAGNGGYGLSDFAGLAAAVKDLVSLSSHGGAYGPSAKFALESAIGRLEDDFCQLKPSMLDLWSDDAKDVISQEAGMLLDKIREEALRLLLKLSDAQINHESYETVVLNGSVLPFPQYTLGVIKLLASYSDTLNLILPVEVGGDGTVTMNPWKTYVLTLLTHMQLNTEEKSKSYKDERLGHIFPMNNAIRHGKSPTLSFDSTCA
ncbi:hypothetical protein E2562_028354 [Oryza meyeriana var. granulata]|uniref:Exocyst subunit Exo70 family protein n=1 Tax=Oryza meyeriana var. granulata TaxID=110450 RepID=A0A6G1CU90_9ORYZ|nr:hypothetical protein E2562_028354 [Oryza meyeriana var. granulata]